VGGRYVVHPRYGPQLNLRDLRQAEPGSYELEELLDGPQRSAEQMEADLRELIATVRRPHLRILLERLIGPRAEGWPAYRDAPAAKFYHQAYRHGLLEHCLTVGQAVSAISATFAGIDRDVAVTGALLHDIGKLEAYTDDPAAIDLTDDGRLQGEIALGYYRVRREIEEIDGLPAAAGEGAGAHHPLPPRHARARQPGAARDPRGDARAHDRQPRRAPGQLRPAREGAARRRALVVLRPRTRRRRLLRHPRAARRAPARRRVKPAASALGTAPERVPACYAQRAMAVNSQA
jgi:putative nucleotidyltransferase with HDIG domain